MSALRGAATAAAAVAAVKCASCATATTTASATKATATATNESLSSCKSRLAGASNLLHVPLALTLSLSLGLQLCKAANNYKQLAALLCHVKCVKCCCLPALLLLFCCRCLSLCECTLIILLLQPEAATKDCQRCVSRVTQQKPTSFSLRFNLYEHPYELSLESFNCKAA